MIVVIVRKGISTGLKSVSKKWIAMVNRSRKYRHRQSEIVTGPPSKVSTINLVRTGYSVAAANATNQQLDVSVQWARPSMAQSYDVYIGPNSGALVLVSDNQSARVYVPTLALDSTYYMRIDSVNTEGTTTGDVFSFSTWASSDIQLDEPGGNPVTDDQGNYIDTRTPT